MLTSQVFWRLSLILTLFALLLVLAWGVFCGTPPSENDPQALSTWRWRCAIMAVVTLASSFLLSRMLIRPLNERLEALDRIARQLSPTAPSLELTGHSGADDEPIGEVFHNVGQQVAAHIASLQTEQHRLEQSHDRLAIVLEAMVEGVIAVDRDERILLANTAAAGLLDVKPDRLTAHPLESLRLPRLQELVKEAIAGVEQDGLEISVPRTQLTVVAVASRLPGEPCPGAVIVLHDVTELRRLESLRRDFVSNVSHELKTPLAAISAYTETLLDGALDDPAINRGFVSRIEEHAERLNRLILDLLELARLEADDSVFEIEVVDIGKVMQTSITDHLNIARSKNVSLTATPAPESIWGLADPGGLRTIIDNLIDNAIKYTPQAGQINVRYWRDGGWVCIEVQDTGVGIAKEHQSRIFERFFRVDRARSREVGGTGLGLSIVKHLCQLFGGEVKVTSRLGQGSCFLVRLRAAAPVAN